MCVCGVSTCTEAMKHSIYRTRGTLRVAATTEISCERSRVQGIGLSRGPSIGSSQSASQRGLKFPGGSPRGTTSSNVDVLGAHFYSIALLGVTSQPWFCSFFHRYPREPRVPWERKTVASCLSAKTHVNSVKPPRLPSMTLQSRFDPRSIDPPPTFARKCFLADDSFPQFSRGMTNLLVHETSRQPLSHGARELGPPNSSATTGSVYLLSKLEQPIVDGFVWMAKDPSFSNCGLFLRAFLKRKGEGVPGVSVR